MNEQEETQENSRAQNVVLIVVLVGSVVLCAVMIPVIIGSMFDDNFDYANSQCEKFEDITNTKLEKSDEVLSHSFVDQYVCYVKVDDKYVPSWRVSKIYDIERDVYLLEVKNGQ